MALTKTLIRYTALLGFILYKMNTDVHTVCMLYTVYHIEPSQHFLEGTGKCPTGCGAACSTEGSMTRCRASSSACARLCTSKKVAAPCCLCWPWTPHPQEARVPSPGLLPRAGTDTQVPCQLGPQRPLWCPSMGSPLPALLKTSDGSSWPTLPASAGWSRGPAPASAVYPLYVAAVSQNNKSTFLCSPVILIVINSNCSLSASQRVHTNSLGLG